MQFLIKVLVVCFQLLFTKFKYFLSGRAGTLMNLLMVNRIKLKFGRYINFRVQISKMKLLSVYKQQFAWNYLEWLKTLKMILSNLSLVTSLILGWRFQNESFECLQRIFFLETPVMTENLKYDPIKQKFGKQTNFRVQISKI